MIRRFAALTLSALTLAGILAFSVPAAARGPRALLCKIDTPEGSVTYGIKIDPDGGMRAAVAECRANGGHPAGVIN